MLRHLSAQIALTFVLVGLTALNATAHTDSIFPQCDLRIEDTVIWAYSGEAVTLSTHVTLDQAEGYPAAQMSLTLADGKVLDLGEGRKYIDDYGDTAPSCADIADIAKAPTLASLTGQAVTGTGNFEYSKSASKPSPQSRTLSSMWAYSVMGQDCMDLVNLPGGNPSPECRRAAEFRERFSAPENMKTLPHDRFMRLVDLDAPTLVVRRSAYYVETYMYDPKTQSLEFVMTDGC